jgi:phosphoglucomutase
VERDPNKQNLDAQTALKALIEASIQISDLQRLTGRNAPTVIT